MSDFYSNPYPESASIYSGVPVFTFKDLEIATKCFDSSRELGEGGFGAVYKVKSSCSSHFNCDSKELFLR